MKPLNILILDDNLVVGEQLKNRMITLDDHAAFSKYRLKIEYLNASENTSYYRFTDHALFEKAVKDKLIESDYLLLDVHYQDINFEKTNQSACKDIIMNIPPGKGTDVQWISKEGKLTDSAREYLMTEATQSTELFRHLSEDIRDKVRKRLKGVIIYTYSPNPDPNRLAGLKNNIIRAFRINENKVEIFSSYKELFQGTDFELYKTQKLSDQFVSIGKKSDFRLYGSMIGEILYHKIVHKEYQRKDKRLKEQKSSYFKTLAFYYVIFISIGFGTNALYDILRNGHGLDAFVLAMFAVLLGVLLPFIILYFKPDLLIPTPKDEDEPR